MSGQGWCPIMRNIRRLRSTRSRCTRIQFSPLRFDVVWTANNWEVWVWFQRRPPICQWRALQHFSLQGKCVHKRFEQKWHGTGDPYWFCQAQEVETSAWKRRWDSTGSSFPLPIHFLTLFIFTGAKRQKITRTGKSEFSFYGSEEETSSSIGCVLLYSVRVCARRKGGVGVCNVSIKCFYERKWFKKVTAQIQVA